MRKTYLDVTSVESGFEPPFSILCGCWNWIFFCPFQGRTLSCSPIYTDHYIFVGSYPSVSLRVFISSSFSSSLFISFPFFFSSLLKINYLSIYPFLLFSRHNFIYVFLFFCFFSTSYSSFLRHFPFALLISILDIRENGGSNPLSILVASR